MSKSSSNPMQAQSTSSAPRRRTMELGFLVMLASVLGACSDHSFVIGNVSSGLLVFGLFYTTLNLKRGEKKRP